MDTLVSNAFTLIMIFVSGAICVFMPNEIYFRWFKPKEGSYPDWLLGLLGFAFWVVGMWLWATS